MSPLRLLKDCGFCLRHSHLFKRSQLSFVAPLVKGLLEEGLSLPVAGEGLGAASIHVGKAGGRASPAEPGHDRSPDPLLDCSFV